MIGALEIVQQYTGEGRVKDRLSHMTVNLAVDFVLMVLTSPEIKRTLPGTLHTTFTLLSDLTHLFM